MYLHRLFCNSVGFFATWPSVIRLFSMFLKRLCFVVLLLGLGLLANAQEGGKSTPKDTVSLPAALDDATMTPRLPSDKRLDDYRASRDYNYERDAPPPDNPLARIWNWLSQKINDFLSSSAYENFWQYVFLVGIAGVVIWLLYKAEFIGGTVSYTHLDVYKRQRRCVSERDVGGTALIYPHPS